MKRRLGQELTERIWVTANILQGSAEPGDYINYISGLTFLKWLSDTFSEGEQKVEHVAESQHFIVPESAKWKTIRGLTTQVGEALNKANKELEEKNTSIEGMVSSIDFATQQDDTLKQLIQEFSKIDMSNKGLVDYDDLIEGLTSGFGKGDVGLYSTPKDVGRLVVALLNPSEKIKIYDPTCGFGGMLIESARYVEQNGGDPKTLSLYGQEIDRSVWRICKMNMLFHDFLDADIKSGDVIRDPKAITGEHLTRFNIVLADPPFSSGQLRREELETDRFGRFHYGIPPYRGDSFAFVEHMIATLDEKGKLGVIVPHGVLFRSGSEAKIRKAILKEDIIEAIIGLPSNLFFGTSIPAVVMVINKSKPLERKDSLLVIDASNECRKGKIRSTLRDDNIERIVNAYNSYKDVENFCKVVPISEIEKNDYNLNISGYVEIHPEEETIDIESVLKELQEIREKRREIEKKMDTCLKVLGYNI